MKTLQTQQLKVLAANFSQVSVPLRAVEAEMVRPLVFLDIDDVLCLNTRFSGFDVIDAFKKQRAGDPLALDLNPELWEEIFFARGVANLRTLDDEFQPRYVLSTSWRQHFNEDEMREVFSRTGLDFVNERLHHAWETPRTFSGSPRHIEIRNWLRTHGVVGQPMLIIDDTYSGCGIEYSDFGINGQAVLCQPNVGFVSDRLHLAQRLLRAQLSGVHKRKHRKPVMVANTAPFVVVGDGCSICHGSGRDVVGNACPFPGCLMGLAVGKSF